MRHWISIAVLTLSTIAAAAAEPAKPVAPVLDPAWKVPEVIEFIGVKKGDVVADIVAGRLTGSLAEAVGPKGKVYAVETAEVVKAHPQAVGRMKEVAQRFPNIVISAEPVSTPLPHGLDAVFIRQNYHDLYDKFMGPADVPAFNKAVFAALKPGGVYVVLDHVATAGSGISATETLHRIDPARVKSDVLAAGFTLDLGIISVGVLAFINVSISASCILPFDNRAATFTASIGREVKWKSITIEITNEPVTTEINKKLPWLKSWEGGLDGSHSRYYDHRASLANSLNSASSRKGI